MPRKTTKKKEEVKEDIGEVIEAPKPEVVVEESAAKVSFRAYMDSYKVKNPIKYARKEEELLKHLNSL